MSQTLIIQPVSPLPGSTVNQTGDSEILLVVQITLGCGCPTCAGGRWDASRFRVEARITSDPAKAPVSIPMKYSGRVSEFCCTVPVSKTGHYQVEVMASDPETGLAGRTHVNFSVDSRTAL